MRGANYPAYVVLAALLIGLLIGWWVIGWWLWPVEWTDALPVDLAPEYRQTYVLGVAYTLQATRDVDRARQALSTFGTPEQQSRVLAEVLEGASPEDADVLMEMYRELGLPPIAAREVTPAGAKSPLRSLVIALVAVLAVGLLGLLGLAAYNWGRRASLTRPNFPKPTGLADMFRERLRSLSQKLPSPSVPSAGQPSEGRDPGVRPLDIFTLTFQQGIPDYTESFNLSAPDGSGYLGECGMGVAETLGGDDNKVTALEVWLFDKKDIRTQAYVLLSEYAQGDATLRTRLERRGRVIPAQPGQQFVIESQSMRLVGEVLTVSYADGDAPPSSVFREVEVNLAVYLKEKGGE